MTKEEDRPQALSQELKAAIRQKIVQYTVVAALALIGLAGTGWMLYLKNRLPNWVNGVPSGAVIAFDLSTPCPEGWSSFDDAAGRFILGSGQGAGLKNQNFRAVDGKEDHKLVLEELPAQKLKIDNLAFESPSGDRFNAGGTNYLVIGKGPKEFDIGGSGTAIPILPPFIALRYCKKD